MKSMQQDLESIISRNKISDSTLQEMLMDMLKADPLYQPTRFWTSCIEEILLDIELNGFHTFKSHSSALKYYVKRNADFLHLFPILPLDQVFEELNGYSFQVNAENALQLKVGNLLKRSMDGHQLSLSDYRVFRAADIEDKAPVVKDVSEDRFGQPLDLFEMDGKLYSPTMLEYLVMLSFLKKYSDTSCIQNVLEIGGGFGTLGEILLKASPENHYLYVNVDIPPVAYVSQMYLKSLFGPHKVAGYDELKNLTLIDLKELSKKYRAIVLCPWQLERLQGEFQVAVNCASFQEMEPEVVENYASHIQRLLKGKLLLKNSRVGKVQKGSGDEPGVENPINSNDYLKIFSKFKLVKTDYSTFGSYKRNKTQSGESQFIADLILLENESANS